MKPHPVLLSMALTLSTSHALAADGYPPYVKDKKLEAKVDLRGKRAPALKVQEWLSGSAPVTDGKVVLIDFWATWCPDCRKFLPELNGFKKKFGEDLVIVGITAESPDTVKQFMKDTPIDYSVGVDARKKMYAKVGVKGIPYVLVISPDRVVRWQGYPSTVEDPLTADKIAQIIAASKAQ